MLIPIPLIGQAYNHRSMPLSAQTLKNWFVEINKEAQSAVSLQPWPGLVSRLSGTGADGGVHTFSGTLYKVTGNTLYSVDSSWADTAIGTIAGSGPCSFISNDVSMVIVRSGNVYEYDGTTLTKATDADFESPDFVTYLNNQALYDGSGARFSVSDAGSLIEIDSLNYATAESAGDTLIRPYAYNQLIYMFGTKTTEQWYNSGVGNPPVDRIQSGIIQRGTKAGHSIASNADFIYFLGDDNIIYRLSGSQALPVSTIPLAQEFASYSNLESAIGYCFALFGQQFYYFHVPGAKTWCFCEDSGGWHELTTGSDQLAYGMTGYAEAYGYQLFSKNGNIYSLDSSTYTNAGDTILRERVSFPISAELLGKQYAGRRLQMDSLELVIKTVAAVTGQGSSPIVMVSYSDNNGSTWSNERQMQAASAGTYTWRLNTQQLGQFYERLIRVRVSDPIVSSIQGCSANIGVGIG